MNELITSTSTDIREQAIPDSGTTALLSRMDINQRSRSTYQRGLLLFIRYCNENHLQGGKADIIEYKHHLLARGLQPATINLYLSSIRAAYRELTDITGEKDPSSGVRNAHTAKGWRHNHLTEIQAAALIEKARGNSMRDYALISLLLFTGLRTIEASRADFGDIEYLHGRRILRVHGKGRDSKDEFVILNEDCWAALSSYLSTRVDARANSPLFIGARGDRLAETSIGELAKSYLAMIGLRGREYSAHSLRHTCACLLYHHGARIEEIQQVLRHSSITTTMRYLESIKEEERLARGVETLLDGVFTDKK